MNIIQFSARCMSQKENNMQAEDTKALEEKDGWKRGGGLVYYLCAAFFRKTNKQLLQL